MTLFETPLFSGLDEAQRCRLVPALEAGVYKPGRSIVFRGEILTRLYFIEHGRVEARYSTNKGKGRLMLGTGDFFGEIGVLEREACDAHVLAALDPTSVCGVDIDAFQRLLGENEDVRLRFLERALERRAQITKAVLDGKALQRAALQAAVNPN